MTILQQTSQKINTVALIAADPRIFKVCAFDKRGEWFIEIIYKGGCKEQAPASAKDVSELESALKGAGWTVIESLCHNGWSARNLLAEVEAETQAKYAARARVYELALRPDPFNLVDPLAFDDADNLIFASGIEW